MMPRQMAVAHAQAIAETMGADEANVELVRMIGVQLVRGRMPAPLRRALNVAVKTGRLGHLRKDGRKPEAYFHPNSRWRAEEMRDAEVRRTISALAGVMAPRELPSELDE